MQLFDPTIGVEQKGIAYAPRPKSLQGLRVGLVENTKFNSEALLRKIAERLQSRYGMTLVKLAHKKSAGTPVYDHDVAEFKSRVDFVIAGIGD